MIDPTVAARPSPDWRFVWRSARWALLVVPVGWAVLVVRNWGFVPEGGLPTDAFAYWRAQEALRSVGSPYVPLPPPGPVTYLDIWYLYPPPMAALVALFEPGFLAFYNALLVLNVIGIALFSWAVARLAGARSLWATLAVMAILAAWPPVHESILTGNIHTTVMALAVFGLAAGPAAGGASLASGAALKVTPLWPLVIRAVRAGRGVWIGAAAALIVLTALSLHVMGAADLWSASRTWVRDVAPALAQGQFDTGYAWPAWNISPVFAPLYLLLPDWPPGVVLPMWARAYLTSVQFVVPLSTILLTRRTEESEQAGWVLLAATLSAPILRAEYLPVLLLVPALVLRRRHARSDQAATILA